MNRLILYSLKIIESEIYNNKLIRYIANVSILLLVLFLQLGDITLKVTGNYIMLVWIAINVCLTFGIFLKNNREHILCIGKLGDGKRYFFLILLSMINNVPWLFILLFQLIIVFEAAWSNAIIIVFVQYIYVISLGAVCGTFKIRGMGSALIGIFGIYNFIFCNPYNYEASSHMFIVSESVFTVNNLNAESMISNIIWALFFLSLTYIKVKMNAKKMRKETVFIIFIFTTLYTIFLQNSLCRYQNENNGEYQIYADDSKMKYKGISDMQMIDIANIIDKMEDEYCNVSGNESRYDEIYIQKQFLPEMMWFMKDLDMHAIEIKENTLNINVMSPNMLYFENSDLLKCFLEEICVEMEVNVSGYDKSKFTRHIMNGYSMGILENVSENLEIESSKEVYHYYSKYYDEMLTLPSTKYNYIKKIAYIVYSDYPEYTNDLYTSIREKKINSDEDFMNLLKNDFEDIYENRKVADILNSIY